MQEWLDFYRDLLHFRELHELDPASPVPADSRVMVSPCRQLQIPLYEEGTARTNQLHAYLPDHPGEGVQHIALATRDICACVDALAANGIEFVAPPDAYYDTVDARLPGHGLDLAALRARRVLIDGDIGADGVPRLFLQTFIKRAPGEIFFEIVQRSGHPGFGEGNLSVLAHARPGPARG
jgi:4-hydroxyphenylpyruvate dioxygenase